ncbi:MAG: hypothetical protein P8J14_04830 [Emcibacteraceae bacterium]|nr:hypothetical protein [Emcibacteraceae bacterium]
MQDSNQLKLKDLPVGSSFTLIRDGQDYTKGELETYGKNKTSTRRFSVRLIGSEKANSFSEQCAVKLLQ